MGQDLILTEEHIAYIAHEANRAMQALYADDVPALPWFWESRDLRGNAIAGVRRVLAGVTPEENHAQWVADKIAQGWTLNEKDIEKKWHPCLVPYHELPRAERAKVRVFFAIVKALEEEMEENGKL